MALRCSFLLIAAALLSGAAAAQDAAKTRLRGTDQGTVVERRKLTIDVEGTTPDEAKLIYEDFIHKLVLIKTKPAEKQDQFLYSSLIGFWKNLWGHSSAFSSLGADALAKVDPSADAVATISADATARQVAKEVIHEFLEAYHGEATPEALLETAVSMGLQILDVYVGLPERKLTSVAAPKKVDVASMPEAARHADELLAGLASGQPITELEEPFRRLQEAIVEHAAPATKLENLAASGAIDRAAKAFREAHAEGKSPRALLDHSLDSGSELVRHATGMHVAFGYMHTDDEYVTDKPTAAPTSKPITDAPTPTPTAGPTPTPTPSPSGQPTDRPSSEPTDQPSDQPSGQPSGQPSSKPSSEPSGQPSGQPSSKPSSEPSNLPSGQPSGQPSSKPSSEPSAQPSDQPSGQPTCALDRGSSCNFDAAIPFLEDDCCDAGGTIGWCVPILNACGNCRAPGELCGGDNRIVPRPALGQCCKLTLDSFAEIGEIFGADYFDCRQEDDDPRTCLQCREVLQSCGDQEDPPCCGNSIVGDLECRNGRCRECFPADATVRLADGATKTMAQLQLGDAVLDASGAYSPIYFFGHADKDVEARFVDLTLASGYKLSLSADHYLVLDGKHVYAKDVAVGDELPYFDEGAFKTSSVSAISETTKSGLFNPYTLSGSIVVDGVTASCHSSWILDGVVSPATAAVVYQHLFAVPRAAYKILGPRGMDAVFGVGNTGNTASIAYQTGALFGVLGLLALGAAAAVKTTAALAFQARAD